MLCEDPYTKRVRRTGTDPEKMSAKYTFYPERLPRKYRALAKVNGKHSNNPIRKRGEDHRGSTDSTEAVKTCSSPSALGRRS